MGYKWLKWAVEWVISKSCEMSKTSQKIINNHKKLVKSKGFEWKRALFE